MVVVPSVSPGSQILSSRAESVADAVYGNNDHLVVEFGSSKRPLEHNGDELERFVVFCLVFWGRPWFLNSERIPDTLGALALFICYGKHENSGRRASGQNLFGILAA